MYIEALFLCRCYYGGAPEIVEGRANVTEVSLAELTDDIFNSSSEDGYCFLHVLEEADQNEFLSRLIKSTDSTIAAHIYQRRAIKLGVWL
jgi:hypothetical protein